MSIKNSTFFCSWSGGKDSCFALYHAIRGGGIPKALLTMLSEDGKWSRAHRLPVALIRRQAAALGIPLIVRKSSWDNYEKIFLSAIRKLRKEAVKCGVFGDIDLEAHLEWVERVCSSADIEPYEPLWKKKRHELLNEFLQLGFKTMIVAVKQGVLDNTFLGRTLDQQLIIEMEKVGIDASGEEGEYHTVVTGGPIFSSPVHIERKGISVHSDYCFLDLA